jgi:diguanylate cyclase (GGDEF)-like protein
VLGKIRSFMTLEQDAHELNRARYRALCKQVPLMYGLLAINLIGLSATHISSAPIWMTFLFPAAIIAFMAVRTLKYIQSRHMVLSDEAIYSSLKHTIRLTAPLAAIFAIWGLLFMPYGNASQDAQAIFFNAVSVVVCAFCMVHLRQAASLVLVTVSVITCVFLIAQGTVAFVSLALNLALVCLVIGRILIGIERDFILMVHQKTAQRQQHAKLQKLFEENVRLANTDSLTALANRRQFLADIDELVDSCSDKQCSFVVALLDLDGFKPVNDVFGHPAGDQVLIETASRLNRVFAGQDVRIARLGGDEFGVVFRGPGDDENMMALADRTCELLKEPFHFDEGSANLSATMGMARYPDAAGTRSQLFDRADYALYYAKQNSKSEPVFFSEDHEQLIFANSALEQALRDADLEQEMSVEFQPILDLDSGHTLGLEALARWNSPTLGRVRPDLFIKTAENIGLIGRLSEVLFRKAVHEASVWPEHLSLSFNLSAASLTATGPVMRLLSIARRNGISPGRLTFEITESALLKDFESAMEVLDQIREAGAHIAIDDFGTGFSSLAYVHRLPIDILKVDQCFIRDLPQSEKSVNVLKSILSLCDNLDINCVIEGVETQDQFDLICDLGARCIQGYYFSKPLSAGDSHMVLQIEFGQESGAMLRRAAS